MGSTNRIHTIAGWLAFGIAAIVYFFSVERTGSLWDCGEFILGAYKLQVVHPPGAPLFLLIGRLFTIVADIFSDNPEHIAFAVNLMSALATAFAALFVSWTTSMLGKLALVGKDGTPTNNEDLVLAGAGLVAGLSTAFSTSIWFSAVEGEVYALSTFFTAMTLWSMVKWYSLPDSTEHDKWILFTLYSAGLSMGVHLLSLLTFPALAIFYYFKKFKQHTFKGIVLASAVGVGILLFVQLVVIIGIPKLWSFFELIMVNGIGLPFNSGLVPTILLIVGALSGGIYYAHKNGQVLLQQLFVGAALVVIAFSTIGVVVIRANANTPVNMNAPSDAMRLIPYLNREQYGERPLLKGPQFNSQAVRTNKLGDRYGRVGDRYEVVDERYELAYEPSAEVLFPRMGDNSPSRTGIYKEWLGLNPQQPLPAGRPNFVDNINFFVQYQIGWMYWRYFMWNFSGRQNGEQGFKPWDKSGGHWISGIPFIDNLRLYSHRNLPDTLRNDKGRNTYFMLPFLFGLMGLFFHYKKRSQDFLALLAMFIITGIGIIVYSNQPPNEPRERDYVLAGSFFTYAIWIGLGVVALFSLLRDRLSIGGRPASLVAIAVVMVAPLLMGFENFDDHSRREIKASRDYASNFLNSCAPNAIIFTYGDNDTYPLWYAQEVEGIRKDVRVINLSLIAVDWYIDQLRRKVNDSPPVKMSISEAAYRGRNRNQVFYFDTNGAAADPVMDLKRVVEFIGQDNPMRSTNGNLITGLYPVRNTFIPVDREKAIANGIVDAEDAGLIVDQIPVTLSDGYLTKDDVAILDILANNIFERPVYFAVTCRPDKFQGLNDYMELEGLALKVVPIKSQSDGSYGVVGSGRVDVETFYDNFMNKFKFGNFDQYELFVDRSYQPSVQSMQLGVRRAAMQALNESKKDKAMALVDRYFEAFPAMNFSYDYRTMYMLAVYLQAGEYAKAKPHMEILAAELIDKLEFYNSVDPYVIQSSFDTDYALSYQTMESIINNARQAGDEAFVQKLEELFGSYRIQDLENKMRQGQN
ncbi:MAG: DUF2723 domain-containing protein [Saprospiraceae bacterium]|nr:DUF2723 domain-containing protein [Saprospiraceae bacterium]